jgi:outer membrane protein OmpA-like peptidoglycan-associated protein
MPKNLLLADTAKNLGPRFALLLSVLLLALSPGFAQSKADADSGIALLPPPPAAAPAPAQTAKNPHIKPGTDFPHEELFLGYSYLYVPLGALPKADYNGGSASFAYNFNRYIGLAGDFGGYHAGDYGGANISSNIFSYLFGPRISFRNDSRVTPFAQLLLGGGHMGTGLPGVASAQNGFTLATGGGLDVGLTRRFAWRVIQAEYFMTRFNPGVVGFPSHQSGARASSGLLIRWGYKPVMINQSPTAACSVNPNSLTLGQNTVAMLTVNSSDPDGDTLSYTYSATGGMITGTGTTARWDLAGQNPGSYNGTAQVSDGHGGMTSCMAAVTLNPQPPPPNRPPTVSLRVDRPSVVAGERDGLTATCTDPDGDPVTLTWSSNGGQIVGSGGSVQLDTTGLAPNTYTVTVRCQDNHGAAADAAASVQVQAPPPPPEATKISQCDFRLNSARVDNVCKRVLDDVAVRLQNDAQATVVIVGYADPRERRAQTLAGNRATNAVNYLAMSRNIDRSRMSTRIGTGQAGAGAANRHIDIIWVPQGATY